MFTIRCPHCRVLNEIRWIDGEALMDEKSYPTLYIHRDAETGVVTGVSVRCGGCGRMEGVRQ